MILRLLDPILNLHGLEAYALVGAFVFAEAAIVIGFIFPGETAVILGGVVADSVGYVVGQRWGPRLLDLPVLRPASPAHRLRRRPAEQPGRDRGVRGPSWPRPMPQPTTRRPTATQAELSRPPVRAPTGRRRA